MKRGSAGIRDEWAGRFLTWTFLSERSNLRKGERMVRAPHSLVQFVQPALDPWKHDARVCTLLTAIPPLRVDKAVRFAATRCTCTARLSSSLLEDIPNGAETGRGHVHAYKPSDPFLKRGFSRGQFANTATSSCRASLEASLARTGSFLERYSCVMVH
jgi:hypothetical protein